MTHEQGRLTHPTVLDVAKYSLIDARRFHRTLQKKTFGVARASSYITLKKAVDDSQAATMKGY